MTDADIDRMATEILLEANNEKWYEQHARIVTALKLARDSRPIPPASLIYMGLGHVPRDFVPGREP